MKSLKTNQCPKCGAAKLKSWKSLSDDQKFLIERFPGNIEFSPLERQKHRFCERCFFEESESGKNRI